MNESYFIIGSSGLAKEVLLLTKQVYGSLDGFLGFIDLEPEMSKLSCLGNTFPVYKEDQFLANGIRSDVNIFIGIGNPWLIKNIAIKFDGYNFPNLIHPNVLIDESVTFGRGNIITAGCIFTVDINIGDFNIFNLHTTVGHDTTISSANVFNPGTHISGNVIIGDFNLFGTNCSVLQGLSIGNGSTLGALSLANRNIESGTVVVGVPAKPINLR